MRKLGNDDIVVQVEGAIEIVDCRMEWALCADKADTAVDLEYEPEDTSLEAVVDNAAGRGMVVVDMVVEQVNASHAEEVADTADTVNMLAVGAAALVNHVLEKELAQDSFRAKACAEGYELEAA